MAATKPPGKGVTSIASSPSDGMICAMFIVREVFSVVAGEAVLMFFFPPKISEMRLGRWCKLTSPVNSDGTTVLATPELVYTDIYMLGVPCFV